MSQKQTFTSTKHITPYCNKFPSPKPFTIATISTTANGAVVSPPSTPSVTSPSPSCSPNNTVKSPPVASPNPPPTPHSNGGGGNIPPPPPFIPQNFNPTLRPFSTNNNGVTDTVSNIKKNNNINNSIPPPPPPRLPNGAHFSPPAHRPAAPTATLVTTMSPPATVTGPAKPAPPPSGALAAPAAPASATGVRMTSDGKVDPRDPQVRRLVYNMYRGMLDKKHEKANVMLESAPKAHVVEDAGIGARVQSMMRQQTELKDGTMNAGGPPPPPPPPPIPGMLPAIRLPTEVGPLKQKGPPAALAGAMMKEKKPFTYTPGGLDLSEINTQYRPQQNGSEGDPNALNGAPIQSRSFRVLQSVFDNDEPSTEGTVPRIGSPMRVEVPAASPGRTGVTRVPSQALGTRSMTNGGTGNYVIVNGDAKPEGRSASPGPPKYISQNSNEEKELNNRFKSQVRVSIRDEDNPRYRGGSMNGTASLKHGVDDSLTPQQEQQLDLLRRQYEQQQQQQKTHQSTPGSDHQQNNSSQAQQQQQRYSAAATATPPPAPPSSSTPTSPTLPPVAYKTWQAPPSPDSSPQYTNFSPQPYRSLPQPYPEKGRSPNPSKFFKRLQTITDTLSEGQDPQGPVHLPNIRQQQRQHQPYRPQQYPQQQQQYQQPPTHSMGVTVPTGQQASGPGQGNL